MGIRWTSTPPAPASAGVLEAGASEGSHLGAIVPSGVPSEFLRKEQEEEEAWSKQMGMGREILQALDRAFSSTRMRITRSAR